MIKRVLFTMVLAAQFLAISAVKNINVQTQPTTSVDMIATDDPAPCPGCPCGAGGPPPPQVMRADDPAPCPTCDASSGPPTLADLRADDPAPCPTCDASSGPPTALA
jgi:hypothetical protein